jgi:nicotinate-nucleotide adenylyltransferase
MGKTIGIYGGSFDPIHFGHINLAVEMMEIHNLDEVWFCPAKINPHKLPEQPTPPEHRLQMLKLAIEDNPRFRILDVEIMRKDPSYTIDTLRELLATEKGKAEPHCFRLILGDDAARNFYRWHQPDEIVKLVPLLIGRRRLSNGLEDIAGGNLIHEAIKNGITPTRIMEISGTEIRERLRKHLYCKHLVPAKVLDYIYFYHLYSSI